MIGPEDPTALNEVLNRELERGQTPASPGEVLDVKLLEQERTTRELEARVQQLEMIARAHGQIPFRDRTVRPDALQAS